MKVCFVLSHFYPHVGGAESALMGLIRELIKKNIEVRVLTCKDNGDKKYIKYEGIDIYYYDWKIMFGHPLVRACDIVEHVKWADVVHSAVYSPVITVNRVCKKLNKPHVCTVYEVLGKKWYWIESNKIKALMFKMYESLIVHCKCDIFVTDSLATQRDLLKCNKKANTTNIYWVSDGEEKNIKIDKEKFRKYFGLSKHDVVFLNYGRPGKTKGLFIY